MTSFCPKTSSAAGSTCLVLTFWEDHTFQGTVVSQILGMIENKNTPSEQVQEENITRTYIQSLPSRGGKPELCIPRRPSEPPLCSGYGAELLTLKGPIHVDKCFLFHVHSLNNERSILFYIPYMPRPNRPTSTVNVPKTPTYGTCLKVWAMGKEDQGKQSMMKHSK